MNHTEYQRIMKIRSESSLLFIIKDAREAIEAMPDNPKAEHYTNEIYYASMELRHRKQKIKIS